MATQSPIPSTNGNLPMVDAQDVHKYFHNNEVLRGVNMQVQRKEVVCRHRAEWLGQDDLPPLHQPPGKDQPRAHLHRGPTHRLP